MGFYRAVKRLYIPDPLSTQSILWFARVVHNLCETLAGNLSESERGGGLMERTVYTVHGITKRILLISRSFCDREAKYLEMTSITGYRIATKRVLLMESRPASESITTL